MLPSVRPRGACLQNSFFLRCFTIYICVCVYILCKDLSLINNAFVYISARCCVRTRTKTSFVTIEKTFQKLPSRCLQSNNNTPHEEHERESLISTTSLVFENELKYRRRRRERRKRLRKRVHFVHEEKLLRGTKRARLVVKNARRIIIIIIVIEKGRVS